MVAVASDGSHANYLHLTSGPAAEMAIQRAEMRMVKWMCIIKIKDRIPSKELRDRLGTTTIATTTTILWPLECPGLPG